MEKALSMLEEKRNKFKLDIQFFAEDDSDVDNNVDDNDDIDDEEEDVDDKEGKDGDDTGTKGKAGGNDKGKKTFTQGELTKKFTREKRQGRRSAFRELGIDEKDTETIKAVKQFLSERKTPEQVAAEAQAANDERIRAAEEKARRAEIKAEALALGAKPEYVDDVVTLVMNNMDEDEEVKDVVSEYKTKYKTLFGSDTDDDSDDSRGKRGTGSSVESTKRKTSKSSLGSRLAQARVKANGSASSLFGKKS